MATILEIANGRCELIAEELRTEFGGILAERILEAEAADFLWEVRVKERYLGQHLDVGLGEDELETELARVAILGFLDGRWIAAACLIDGEGMAVDLLWKRSFDALSEAQEAFDRAA